MLRFRSESLDRIIEVGVGVHPKDRHLKGFFEILSGWTLAPRKGTQGTRLKDMFALQEMGVKDMFALHEMGAGLCGLIF